MSSCLPPVILICLVTRGHLWELTCQWLRQAGQLPPCTSHCQRTSHHLVPEGGGVEGARRGRRWEEEEEEEREEEREEEEGEDEGEGGRRRRRERN